MSRFLKGIKAALGWFIFGLIILITGIVLFLVSINNNNGSMMLVGIIVVFLGIVFTFIIPIGEAQNKMRGICENCQKSMACSGVEYSWETSELGEKFDNQGSFVGIEAIYTCSIKCPHCGNDNMFDHTIIDKNTAKCNKRINDYLKSILRQKK